MSKYYAIGTIVSPHALKGEVKIYSTTDFRAERYKVGNTLYIEQDGVMIELKIKSYRTHKNYDLVTFEDYPDINSITPLIKSKLYISEAELQELNEDEFYYHELYDCKVYHNDNLIGNVVDVVNYGASDILVIKTEKNQEIMIPFVDDFIKLVDSDNKIIDINVIEGLINNED
jgi:16S rRNA processing protein RimM